MKIVLDGKSLYESQPRQTLFHYSQAQCRLYGGAAGGGKTYSILWELFALCNDPVFSKLRCAVFRKTIPDIEKYFINPALEMFPAHDSSGKKLYTYNKQKRVMKFHATGSTIEFNYCQSEIDLTAYQGAQWDVLAIDEFTQHSEYVFKYLFGRLRTNKPGWKVRFFGGSNPGGIGHAWVKRIWIDRELTEQEAKFTWEFVPARLEDNPKMLENNPTYEDQLMLLPDEMMRRALRYGDWNIFAGQFFPELRQEIHGFEPFTIPRQWKKFLEIDYGFDHPAVCHWNAVDEDGEIWKYRELVCRHKTYREFAKQILEMTPEEEKIDYAVADPSIWAKKGSGDGMSGAEEMQEVLDERKINLQEANNDRINGWGILREFIKIFKRRNSVTGKDELHTRFHVSNALTFWWKWVPNVQRDPKRPEDVLKATIQTEDGSLTYSDDSADATRYGAMSRPEPFKKKPEEEDVDRDGMKVKKGRGLKIVGRTEWMPAKSQRDRIKYHGHKR